MRDIGRDDFFTPGVTFGTFKSKLWGIPLAGVPILMYYRKDWLEEEGITPPTTWDDILGAAKKLNGKTKGGAQIAAVSGYFGPPHAAVFLQNHLGPNNAHLFDQQGKVAVSSKETREALQQIRAMVPYYQPGYTNMNYGDTGNMFSDGKLAIQWGSTTTATSLVRSKQDVGSKSAAVLLPWGPSSKKDGGGYNGINYLTLGAQSKNADLVRDFLKWHYSPPIYSEIYRSLDWAFVPQRRSVATDAEWLKVVPANARPSIDAGVKAAEVGTVPAQDFGPNPLANKLIAEDFYRNILQKTAGTSDSIDDVVKWADGEIKRIIKDA